MPDNHSNGTPKNVITSPQKQMTGKTNKTKLQLKCHS